MRATYILAIALMLSIRPAVALPRYLCEIERIHSADGESDPNILLKRKLFIGKTFTVDRVTGVMNGVLKNTYMTQPVVIDQGTSENAFKAVTTMRIEQGAGAGSSVYALVVKEYKELPAKPFVYLNDDIAYFGKCFHIKE